MNKILPPTHFFIYLIVSVALHFTLPLLQIINYPFNLIGFLFFVLGAGLNIWADQLFKKELTTIKPSEKPTALIQTGPYKLSRNPMYLGMVLLLIGAGFILGSLTSFIGTVLFAVMMEIVFIPIEEKILQDQFGEEYEVYKEKVGKWL
jgi:protein-S-isoprenylcysteine O-methyltransferase Ste14